MHAQQVKEIKWYKYGWEALCCLPSLPSHHLHPSPISPTPLPSHHLHPSPPITCAPPLPSPAPLPSLTYTRPPPLPSHSLLLPPSPTHPSPPPPGKAGSNPDVPLCCRWGAVHWCTCLDSIQRVQWWAPMGTVAVSSCWPIPAHGWTTVGFMKYL